MESSVQEVSNVIDPAGQKAWEKSNEIWPQDLKHLGFLSFHL